MKFLALVFLPLAWAALYCPSASDLEQSWNNTETNPTIVDGGWTIHGGGGVVSKSSWNLLNGWFSYNLDVSKSLLGVNSNIYLITPKYRSTSYNPAVDYCDGNNDNWCPEVDLIESNGNCGGQTTLHTVPGTGSSQNCNGWGCGVGYTYTDGASFSMNHSFDSNGVWTATLNGRNVGALNPTPQSLDWNNLKNAFTSVGATISSTQWVGWVPSPPGCASVNGTLANAIMTISNLRISGTLIQGPAPKQC